ncbi:MAG: glycosyltransferase [Lachnospiraceae bacterium]|nr:glycosyltransferase [Lachnospiraceae bacterium]
MSEIKVSVIIPIHNVEAYVKECVESVLRQTLKEIEVICVDDASTDASSEIISGLAKQDERVRLITYKENKSASQARKDGVELAKGEYILFLDGDDSLRQNACEDLYLLARKKKVDILHFGTEVINYGNADTKRIENLYKLLKPYYHKVTGTDVFHKCFVEKNFRFTLWNKLYTAQLCKKAFSYVEDGNFPKAQDLYAFFVLCYYAKSYYGVREQYYNYRFGAGITGKKKITLDQFERFCTSEWTAKAIQGFAEKIPDNEVKNAAEQIRYDLLNDCINNWYNFLPSSEQAAGFDLLAKYWRPDELSAKMCERFFGRHALLAECINGAKSMHIKPRKVKTIGIFYYRYSIGGVQRVISLLIPMFLQMGYKVVFFVEEVADIEYEIPEGVERVVLPPSYLILKVDYIKRAVVLQRMLEEYKIDLMVYNAASSTKLLFEIIIMKLLNIPMILVVHEVAFQGMLTVNKELANRPSVFRLADKVVVLSSTEELYWRLLGVNAYYIPNPISNQIVNRDKAEIENNTIVWVGRLDFNTKRCMDAVDAMKMVVSEVPDAKLLIIGNEVTKGAVKQLENKIRKSGLENNVILCGETTNIDLYYKKASIHLLTSVSETFPMTIVESKSFGIPLVMYNLPFIEITKSGKGLISVPQGNKNLLSEAIVKILKDDEYREKLGEEAKNSLAEFLQYDLKKAWSDLIESPIEKEKISNIGDKKYEVLMQSMLMHYGEGSRRNYKRIKDYEKIENSKDYKIGRILLRYPKKIYYKLLKWSKRHK